MTTTPSVTIFHNPGCSKSRDALTILEQRSIEHAVIDYLTAPPSRDQLESIIDRLIDPLPDLVRRTDERFAELGLDPSAYQDTGEIVELLLAHPELMQRPIVVGGGKAVIARPGERVALVLP